MSLDLNPFRFVSMHLSVRGQKIHGERQGKRGVRENLVAARRKGEKDLITSTIFTGSLNAQGFEGWFSSAIR